MGVVRRQGVKDSIVTYVGFMLGAANTLYFYPKFLSDEQIGLINFLLYWALLLAPFLQLGANSLVLRYFPVFKDEKRGHNGLLALMLVLPVLASFFLLLLLWLGQIWWRPWLAGQSPLIQQFAPYIPLLAIVMTYGQLLANYTKNFLRIVVPGLLENVLTKIGWSLLALALFFQILPLSGVAYYLIAVYGLVLIGNILYTAHLGQLHLRSPAGFLNSDLRRGMIDYGIFGFFGTIGAAALLYLDKVVIPLFMPAEGLAALGVYAIVSYFGIAVDIPRRSIEKITNPLVASAFLKNDLLEVEMLYKKTALNQLIAGLLLFLLIWLNLDDLFSLMPNGEHYRPAKAVVLILGISSLIDMSTGINAQIIGYSRYFRFNLYLLIILAGCNLAFAYLYIRIWDLSIFGAAWAMLTSIALYNLAKLAFIYSKWRWLPFTRNLWLVGLIGLLIGTGVYYLPFPMSPWLAIPLRSAIILGFYLLLILSLRLSPDLNELAQAFSKRFFGR